MSTRRTAEMLTVTSTYSVFQVAGIFLAVPLSSLSFFSHKKTIFTVLQSGSLLCLLIVTVNGTTWTRFPVSQMTASSFLSRTYQSISSAYVKIMRDELVQFFFFGLSLLRLPPSLLVVCGTILGQPSHANLQLCPFSFGFKNIIYFFICAKKNLCLNELLYLSPFTDPIPRGLTQPFTKASKLGHCSPWGRRNQPPSSKERK